MSEPDASGDVTRLLVQWREGREGALDRLLPLVYDQLRRLAARQLRRERPDHTLQPTALINDLLLLLVRRRGAAAGVVKQAEESGPARPPLSPSVVSCRHPKFKKGPVEC